MALEAVPESRVLIESEGSATVVSMPAARQWFTIVFLPVWVLMWFWGEVSKVREIASSSRPIGAKRISPRLGCALDGGRGLGHLHTCVASI